MSHQTTEGPCCGTAEAAVQAGACCDPAARTEAVAAGATCCGGTTTAAGPTADDQVDRAARLASPTLRATDVLPVVVIGAGPVGLAAVAHLHERGLPFIVLESGRTAGAAVGASSHVRLFSHTATSGGGCCG